MDFIKCLLGKERKEVCLFTAILFDSENPDPWKYPIYSSDLDLSNQIFFVEHKGNKLAFYIDFGMIYEGKAYYRIEYPLPMNSFEHILESEKIAKENCS